MVESQLAQLAERSGTTNDDPKKRVSDEKRSEKEVVEDRDIQMEKGIEKNKLSEKKTPLPPSDARNLDRLVAYLSRLVERKLNEKFVKFIRVMKGLHINIFFLEAITQIPFYAKFLKGILSNKKKTGEDLVTLLFQVSALVQHKMPKEQQDLWSFTLPGNIGNSEAKGALADASVSLIPFSIAQQLNIELIHTRKKIQLVDRSLKLPCGELKDVPIQVGHIYVPCDLKCHGHGGR
ncbi:uncharacterized protein LOC110739826 [Chenopodium quinoa]|uniref:uncharacterized protein LOC110739826 n=1 Tax=Chenopodium quinoa TaxID=63459 RepID=UPI000B78E9D4|nr:uncharacterized protein LOC110739826 [Chenopodium quinoa]